MELFWNCNNRGNFGLHQLLVYADTFSVLAEIYKKITGIEPPTSGIALKKLYEKVAKTLAAKNKSMFVILDDADFLILSEYPAACGD